LKLKLLFTYKGNLKPAVEIGVGPHGTRKFAEIIGGSFEGDRIHGTVLSGGGDWILIDSNGIGHIDVRVIFETEDNAHIYVQYYGKLIFNEKVNMALAEDREMEFGDTYFMSQPRFETGDARYAWLNNIIAVAEGRLLKNAFEYRVYECIND